MTESKTTGVSPTAINVAPEIVVGSPPGFSSSPPNFSTSPPNDAVNANSFFDSAASDRRGSDEWDASKVPPSRFQKRKGSIYSTPGSRDGHVDNNYAAKFHAKHAELGYNSKK